MTSLLKRMIPLKVAVWTTILLNAAIIIFHSLVLTGYIPFDIVWAGRLKSVNEMVIFESVSIGINAFLILIIATKAGWLKWAPSWMINGVLWVFVILFVLNTIGNLTAISTLEKVLGTTITALLAILCWRIAIAKQNEV
jgi:hypothetical protein